MKTNFKNKRAFTLIELLIVIAIIGILFIVLVSKVDFATDKAKATGVQTDFRSFQVALDQVAKENAGFNTFGYNTGDNAGAIPVGYAFVDENAKNATIGDGIRNSYDQGDKNLNGKQDVNGVDGYTGTTEVWTGRKIYTETWSEVYTLTKPGTTGLDATAVFALESAINANLDPKLHITISATDGKITMANQARDPWKNEYHGVYISKSERDGGADRGAIIIYSNGANGKWGSAHDITNGVVSVTVPGNNTYGKDDYSLVSCYTFVNGYGEVKNITTGFSNNQTMLAGNNGGVAVTPNVPETPDDPNVPVNGVYEMLEGENQTFDAETSTDLSFRSKADFNKFSGVNVDGVPVASTNYTVSEGSTIVTLKADYLQTLDAGNHYVEIVSDDGIATTEFTINKSNRITFTINDVTYYAEEGMTWGDFRRSGLNVEQGGPVSENSPPVEYIEDTIPVYNPGCFGILYNGVQVVYGDIIIAGGAYISDNPHKR